MSARWVFERGCDLPPRLCSCACALTSQKVRDAVVKRHSSTGEEYKTIVVALMDRANFLLQLPVEEDSAPPTNPLLAREFTEPSEQQSSNNVRPSSECCSWMPNHLFVQAKKLWAKLGRIVKTVGKLNQLAKFRKKILAKEQAVDQQENEFVDFILTDGVSLKILRSLMNSRANCATKRLNALLTFRYTTVPC